MNRVAAAQTFAVAGDTPATVAKVEAFIRQAGANGAEVVVFPETLALASAEAGVFVVVGIIEQRGGLRTASPSCSTPNSVSLATIES